MLNLFVFDGIFQRDVLSPRTRRMVSFSTRNISCMPPSRYEKRDKQLRRRSVYEININTSLWSMDDNWSFIKVTESK